MSDWHRAGDDSELARRARKATGPARDPESPVPAAAAAGRLAMTDARQLAPADVARLQQVAGNAAVTSLMDRARRTTVDADAGVVAPAGPSQVTQVAVPSPAMSFSAVIKRSDRDAEPGGEDSGGPSGDEVDSSVGGGSTDVGTLDEGQTLNLPDITMPEDMGLDADSVAGSLSYAASISQSGTVSPFGATSWATFNLTGISVTASSGSYAVSATVQNPITFNVASGGNTNVASDSDASLTAANYATAASDLTPNTSDLGGRPPRTQFWAEDLTIRHENFHANERQTYGGQGVTTAQGWLSTQTASSVADVVTLLKQVPARIIAVSQAAMPYPAKEERAYGDGVSAYQGRADAIKAKGDAGGYT